MQKCCARFPDPFTATQRRSLTEVARQAKLSSISFVPCDTRQTVFRAIQLGVSAAWQRTAIQHPGFRAHEKAVYTKLPEFDEADFAVAKEFRIEGSDKIKDSVMVEWDRDKAFVEFHKELYTCINAVDKDGRDMGQKSRRVKHLGHPVYEQYNKYPLDPDA